MYVDHRVNLQETEHASADPSLQLASPVQAVHCVQGTYGTGSHAFSTISSSGALTLAQLWQNLNRSPDVMRAILDPCGQSDWLKKVMDDMSCGEDDAKWLQKQLLKFMALPFPYRWVRNLEKSFCCTGTDSKCIHAERTLIDNLQHLHLSNVDMSG